MVLYTVAGEVGNWSVARLLMMYSPSYGVGSGVELHHSSLGMRILSN